ncbi:hypothetical protein J2X01_004448, partial [Arthrobacter ginsengisoli]|nr:hypothetical protein [Arthrobacter ginsengisoli]
TTIALSLVAISITATLTLPERFKTSLHEDH